MQTGVEQVDDTTVKLTVTVEAERVSKAIDQAARELSAGMRVPGFRPGRVPRKVLESRIGKGALVEEAVRDAVPTFYAEAVQAEGLPVVGPPSIDVSTFEDGKDAEFTATVEVRPKIDVPDYSCIQIAYPDWEVTEEEIDRELDGMRDRFAELETVKRPADYGDFVVVTITGKRGEEVIEQASGQDLLYPLGSSGPDAAMDKALEGKEAGAIVRFNDTLGDSYPEALRGQELNFTAIVKEVKRKKLPELDDDFAVTASEFDTIEELRDDLTEQLSEQRKQHAAAELRQKVMEAVVDLVDVSLPDSMVDEELRFSLGRFQRQAAAHGMSEEDLAAAMAEDVVEGLTEQARDTVKAQLVLDAVGRDAGIMVVNEDIAAEVARQAMRLGQPPEKLAEFMLHPDRVGVLYTDAFRRKAIDHLVASVEVRGGPPPEEVAETSEAAETTDDAGTDDPEAP
ncbi:MAG: trigger factor [Egibacteraceae bacterium]